MPSIGQRKGKKTKEAELEAIRVKIRKSQEALSGDAAIPPKRPDPRFIATVISATGPLR